MLVIDDSDSLDVDDNTPQWMDDRLTIDGK